MPYGAIFSNTLRLIWKEKKLWLFAIIGLLLSALVSLIYLVQVLNWQSAMLAFATDPAGISNVDSDAFFSTVVGGVRTIFGGITLMGAAGLIGYILNLIMRGATISEADQVLAGGDADVGRGSRVGLSRALRLFGVDLLWWIPLLVILVSGVVYGWNSISSYIGLFSGGHESTAELVASFNSIVSGLSNTVAILSCLTLVFIVLRVLFAPLMYQSAVQGKVSFFGALKQGFGLAISNLGAMIVFLILILILQIVLVIILLLLAVPLMGIWMSSWTNQMIGFFMGSEAASGAGSTLAIIASLILALLVFLASTYVQSFKLSLYANMYRRLTGGSAEESSAQEVDAEAGVQEEQPVAETAAVVDSYAAEEDADSAPAEDEAIDADSEYTASEGEDDLTAINGIGSSYAKLLTEAGIASCAAVASSDVQALQEIIDAPEWRNVDYADWIEQAKAMGKRAEV